MSVVGNVNALSVQVYLYARLSVSCIHLCALVCTCSHAYTCVHMCIFVCMCACVSQLGLL